MQKISHTGCIDMASTKYESSYFYQEYSSRKMLSHSRYIDMISQLHELSYAGQDESDYNTFPLYCSLDIILNLITLSQFK